jgi:predicted DNA-binding protein
MNARARASEVSPPAVTEGEKPKRRGRPPRFDERTFAISLRLPWSVVRAAKALSQRLGKSEARIYSEAIEAALAEEVRVGEALMEALRQERKEGRKGAR